MKLLPLTTLVAVLAATGGGIHAEFLGGAGGAALPPDEAATPRGLPAAPATEPRNRIALRGDMDMGLESAVSA